MIILIYGFLKSRRIRVGSRPNFRVFLLPKSSNGEFQRSNPISTVVRSSTSANWPNLVAEATLLERELDDLMYPRHVISVNVGEQFPGEIKRDSQ